MNKSQKQFHIKLQKNAKNKRYKDTKVGLHCHVEEKEEYLIDLFEQALKENVRYVAISNYKSLKIITQVLPKISDDVLKKYKKIKLIPTIEIPGRFEYTDLENRTYGIETHILGYGVNINKEKLLNDFVNRKYRELNQEEELQRLVKIGHEIGLEFNDKDAYIDVLDGNRRFAGRAFMQAVMKNMEANFNQENEGNNKKLPFELRRNWGAFQNRCVKDINSPFYLDLTALNPDTTEVIDLIHQMGGKAYLAHPSSYFSKIGNAEEVKKAYDNVVEFALQFMKKHSPDSNPACHIDGIELYHPSYLNHMELLGKMKKLVRYHKLGTSGGTDIHFGNIKMNTPAISHDDRSMRDKKIIIRDLKKFEKLKKSSQTLKQLKYAIKTTKEKSNEMELQ